jgi:hypothetical protein
MNPLQSSSQTSVLSKKNEVDVLKKQLQQDELNQKHFNTAQRHYIKCTRGKCPVIISERMKRMRRLYGKRKNKKNFISSRKHDKQLSRLFIEKGREKRLEILRAEVAELNLKLRVAGNRWHVTEIDENYRKIAEHLRAQSKMKDEIKRAKMEIVHIKSQIERLNSRSRELDRETESEGEIFKWFQIFMRLNSKSIPVQFYEHFKRANHQLEVIEGKVQLARQNECKLTTENRKLCELLQGMLIDRAQFNKCWFDNVKSLENRKKFLLDMIERSSQAFSQSDEYMDNYKRLLSRRRQDMQTDTAEMLKMKRQIDANDIISMFLGRKGKHRYWQPLQDGELDRRENHRAMYSERLNLYKNIISEVRKHTGIGVNDSVKTCVNRLGKWEDEGFRLYNFINKLSIEVEAACKYTSEHGMKVTGEVSKIAQSCDFYETRITSMTKQLEDIMQNQFSMKRDIERLDTSINSQCQSLLDVIKEVGCDTMPLQKNLGDFSKMDGRNFKFFVAQFERHMNRLIACIYCKERDDRRLDLLTASDKLVIKSLKRDADILVKAEDSITTQQCPECAEIEDFNRCDDKFVAMLTSAEVFEMVKKKAVMPEIAQRMHSLSACKLPRSGVVASRRYAQ